jgi:hypothetical protein
MEITHTSTDNTKWDGLGYPAHNNSAVSLVCEFAGGIRSGTIAKPPPPSDREKMFRGARLVVDQNQSHVHRHQKANSLLYFSKQIFRLLACYMFIMLIGIFIV